MNKNQLLIPSLRFKGFDGEWEQKKLGNISNIKTGSKDLKDKVENGIYPFYVRSQKIEKINSFSYDGEAILIPGDGRIGDIFHYINGKFDYHQRVYKISDTKEWLKFIYYLFQKNIKKHLMIYSAKATVDSLRLPMLLDFELNIPSILEQQKIAKFFSLLDKQIELYEKKLNNYDLIYKYYLNKMFANNNENPSLRFKWFNGEWEQKHLKDLFSIIVGGDINKNNFSYKKIDDFIYPIYSNSLENKGLYGWTNKYKISGESITITARGEVGKAIARHCEYFPIIRLICLLPKFNDNVDFFSNQINLIKICNESTGVPQLTSPKVQEIKLYRPLIEEQQKIASFFDKIDQLREKTKQTIIHLNNQKKYYLKNMFV